MHLNKEVFTRIFFSDASCSVAKDTLLWPNLVDSQTSMKKIPKKSPLWSNLPSLSLLLINSDLSDFPFNCFTFCSSLCLRRYWERHEAQRDIKEKLLPNCLAFDIKTRMRLSLFNITCSDQVSFNIEGFTFPRPARDFSLLSYLIVCL